MTRGVAVWVAVSALFSFFVGCTAFVQGVSDGQWGAAIVALCLTPVLFWVLATVGAGVLNVLGVSGQVLQSQVTESAEIQGRKKR
jgi:hypothetical protein